MTIYLMGAEMGAWVPAESSVAEVAWTTGDGFSRGYIDTGENTSYIESATFAAPDECYYNVRLTALTIGSISSKVGLELVAGSTGVFRLVFTETTCQMQAKIAGTYTNVGSAISVSAKDGPYIDLYIDGNSATGTAKLYVAGTLRETASSVDLSSVTGITNLRVYAINSASGFGLSQCIVADEPTIGWRTMTVYPTGAGATGDWTGDYTAVDEMPYSDADFIYSGTNGQVELYTGTAVASLTGYVVRAVGVCARAKCGAGGPQNLQLGLRVNSTNYFSASKALDVGYGAYFHVWETNPDTTADWLTTQISALQFGVKAVT